MDDIIYNERLDNAEVYLKRYIKSDQLWENKPHLAFTIYLAVTMVLFFGGMFLMIDIGFPGWLMTIYLVGIWVVCIAIVLFRNEMCNISKSIAFIKTDEGTYMIKLGYLNDINYQTMGNPIHATLGGLKMAHDIAVAEQVQREEKEIRERRKSAEVYVYVLNKILQTGKLPAGVIEFRKLVNVKVERETKNYFWISFETGSGRKKKMFRNAYGIRF